MLKAIVLLSTVCVCHLPQQIIKTPTSIRKTTPRREARQAKTTLHSPPAKENQIIINNLTRLQAHPQRQGHTGIINLTHKPSHGFSRP